MVLSLALIQNILVFALKFIFVVPACEEMSELLIIILVQLLVSFLTLDVNSIHVQLLHLHS